MIAVVAGSLAVAVICSSYTVVEMARRRLLDWKIGRLHGDIAALRIDVCRSHRIA